MGEYLEKEKALPSPDILRRAERVIMLRTVDMLWMRHIDELKDLREAVSLSGYGQRNPLIEYQNKAYEAFEELITRIDQNIVRGLFHVKINVRLVEQAPKTSSPIGPITPPPSGEFPVTVRVRTNEDQIEQNLDEPSLLASQKGSIDLKNVGRNDPCPCGGGKKFKKCHGA